MCFLILLEAEDPGSRSNTLGVWRELSSWLADGCLLVVSSRDGRRESYGVSFLSHKGTDPIGLGPHPYDRVSPDFLKGPVSKYSQTGVRTSTDEFGEGDTIQSTAYPHPPKHTHVGSVSLHEKFWKRCVFWGCCKRRVWTRSRNKLEFTELKLWIKARPISRAWKSLPDSGYQYKLPPESPTISAFGTLTLLEIV